VDQVGRILVCLDHLHVGGEFEIRGGSEFFPAGRGQVADRYSLGQLVGERAWAGLAVVWVREEPGPW
jgi:hypothetical protein